ncbi:DoxX family protein [Corynebacterium gerontici]|uniref:Oxidoreductase MhqP n=1 Tax=Corynebacterium gerontici TaxID=2079234 RepID=A0A3G6IZU5_9CORY|nr:DoxX family protein [Corynebacterium gerontici]AZA11033.1 Putative oxidoreductase MhqP [Corynebacterium gerontici]
MDRPAIRDAALLILRSVIGVVFVAHGYQKFFLLGITEVTGQFSALGIPQPKLSAVLSASGELLGGALLIVGLLTTFVAGALALLMLAALYFVHMGNGFFLEDTGLEYPLVLIASLIVVIVFGSGRASIDGVLSRAEL